MNMTLKPLADRVIIKQISAEEKTKSGIILTSAAQEKPQVYEVLEVGPGGLVDGNEDQMVVKKGDRVAYIAPNTHAQLESFYAVPQIGAVLVPINYRLNVEEFVYIIDHSGASVLCAASEYLDQLDRVLDRLTGVRHFVALEGQAHGLPGWQPYESLLAGAAAAFDAPPIDESDLLTNNYTSGTTSRPKGVMITHRNAYMNIVGTLLHVPMRISDRYLWTLPMFHANGWTFVWTVTAVGATHICLRKVDPVKVFELASSERITSQCFCINSTPGREKFMAM
jgi:fatty-acyl-CoA synthase